MERLREVNLCVAAGLSYNYYNVGSYLLEHIDLLPLSKLSKRRVKNDVNVTGCRNMSRHHFFWHHQKIFWKFTFANTFLDIGT